MEPTYQQSTTGYDASSITRREIEILSLIAEGNQNKQIASRLAISIETVKTHVKNIYVKINAHNKVEALNKTKWLTSSMLTTNTNC